MIARCLSTAACAALLFGTPQAARAALTYDLRVHTGSPKTANVLVPNDVVMLDLYAQITGAVNNAAVEGFQNGFGSIYSTAGGDISGSLAAQLAAPFNANGSQNGTPADLDGDRDMDLGSNATTSNSAFLFARAGTMQKTGTTITNGQEFLIATVTFTIGSIAPNAAPIMLNFRPADFTGRLDIEALWQEDGLPRNTKGGNGGGAALSGAPVVITAVPEPSSAVLLGFVAVVGLARRRRVRATGSI